MRTLLIGLCAAALLAGCGQSTDNKATAKAAVQPKKKKPAYCFFKDSETKGWAASRGKDGNVKVKGKAYRQDSRYQAVLGPAEISGTTATIAPTITQNMTGYGAENDWWDVAATIPNSSAVDKVAVVCGAKTLAELKVAAKR
jgi:hypothetical protein